MEKPATTFEVSEELSGSALDAVVRAAFGLSWGKARELVRRGKIALNGRTATDATRRVRRGDVIAFDEAAKRVDRENVDLPEGAIVHVDPHVVVVEKPSGMNTIAFDPEGMGASISRRTKPGSDDDAALDKRVAAFLAKKEKSRGSLGIVHRIDRETSGLVVFTRSWVAKKALTQAFRFHHVHRRYLALVHGEATTKTIRTHLVPNRGDGLRGSIEHRHGRKHAVGSEASQEAISHIELVERLEGKAAGRACSLVACRLETGRTHQIRIHLSEEGHPLLGERVYIRGFDAPLPAPRLMLHAAELGFVHPATNREMRWTSEPPPDMAQTLKWLRS